MQRSARVILVLPHQDDEMFIFHRLRLLLSQGSTVFLVWVTDGAAHDAEIRQSPVVRLFFPLLAKRSDATIRAVRTRESITLADCLNISRANLLFLDFPSGRIQDCFSTIVDRLARLFQELEPHAVYTVAFDHSHFEHDASNAAVKFAADRLGTPATLYEFPVLNLARGIVRHRSVASHPGTATLRTPFTHSEERERLKLFRTVFRSQWSVALLEHLLLLFPSEYGDLGEPYRRLPDYDYLKPLPGRQIQYLPRSLKFEGFQLMIRRHLCSVEHSG